MCIRDRYRITVLQCRQATSPFSRGGKFSARRRDGGDFRGTVRFWEGWCGWGAIPPVVARIFSGDSTSPLTREARTWCGARDSAGLGGLVRIGNNPSGSRPILLGDSTSPLTREASLARGEAVDVPLRRLWGLRGSVGVKQSLR